jgi:hypothetical protein
MNKKQAISKVEKSLSLSLPTTQKRVAMALVCNGEVVTPLDLRQFLCKWKEKSMKRCDHEEEDHCL